jgi:heptosyltransferase-1
MSRALLIQLARLGDLIQSLPVLTSLHTHISEQPVDLLCPELLVPLGRLFPNIQRVYPWEGERWHTLATMSGGDKERLIEAAEHYVADCAFPPYAVAYNLNNHPRSIVASHLFSERVVGAGDQGPLDPNLPPWVAYIRQVARDRGTNRIHLADAFCGVCGVPPPNMVPAIQANHADSPSDIGQILNDPSLVKVGIVLGAGDADRKVPLATWRRVLEACVDHVPNCLCVLIGGAGEREAALALEDQLSSHYRSRLLNCVGRTTLPQLAHVFNRCQWVVGSDTGPLHLAVACGARAIGWYFSRARVHETGPYGVGHYVWQHQEGEILKQRETSSFTKEPRLPGAWPVMETIQLIVDDHVDESLPDWKLWSSHRDEWGMFYTNMGKSDEALLQRQDLWERLTDASSHLHGFPLSSGSVAGSSR